MRAHVCVEEGEGSREKLEVLGYFWIFTASKCWKGAISFILDFCWSTKQILSAL